MNHRSLRQLAGPTVMRGVDALRHELLYGPASVWNRWKKGREIAARRRTLLAGLEALRATPPEVLIGANVSLHNGIRFHIEGIRRHSAMNVEFFPADSLLPHVSYDDLSRRFLDDIMAFKPAGIGVIHSHVYPYYVRWCRKWKDSGPLWVHTYHLPYFPVGGTLAPWQTEINETLINDARHAHVRISVSEWQQKYLLDTHGIDTVYIPNGVDAESCDRADASRFRADCGIEDFVLFVGRNEAVKNPLDFLKLARRFPGRSFVAIGPGLTPESLQASSGEELSSNLAALGALPREKVQDALAACTVLVVTSRREGLPTLVLEALLREKPVVVPDDLGCVEAIGGGRFGFVYTHDDMADLEAKTRDALAAVDENRREARDWVLGAYDWKAVAPRVDHIYRTGRPG